MSLQPLLENATRYNSALQYQPLQINIFYEDGKLIIKNNIQIIHNPETSTGIGLANLNERFKILLHKEIEVEKTATDFIVKLPLQQA